MAEGKKWNQSWVRELLQYLTENMHEGRAVYTWHENDGLYVMLPHEVGTLPQFNPPDFTLEDVRLLKEMGVDASA